MDKISKKNLPFPVPVTFTLAVLACAKSFNVSDLVWGMVYCLIGLAWLSYLISIAVDNCVDIFDWSGNSEQQTKTFRQKFEEVLSKQKKEN